MAVKQKVIPRATVQTITRARLLQNTAQEVLEVFKDYHAGHAQWIIDRLDVIIKHQLLAGFELVAYSGDKPATSVQFGFDWKTHKVQQEIKNEIDISGLKDGKTHASTGRVVDVVRNYLGQVNSSVPNVSYEVWIIRNNKVRREMGAEQYYDLLGCEGSVQKEIEDALYYGAIATMKAARRARKVLFPGAEEASMDIR
ncbi:hypothetical protein JANAI62_37780 [Jannaschia pagri]|uniref:Uncharacterized protein n=1 Tax=Jannaschia pagri TaxID=2829797 RepID=A0ABQ4NS77_9RHOB|nr:MULTISPECIES: hypothetical protein [unclassified Jannaschia]GIT93360.1 hypothetical protein JANAI61_38180 [Jannaschia sp. AI_61]GIT97155.1 hypothetical protein JANAI62_37780 [Jannaschia sp. AI_62]